MTLSTALRRGVALQPVAPREEIQILLDRRCGIHSGVVRHEAGELARHFRLFDHRDAVDAHIARLRQIQRGKNPHRCCLARSVGTDETEDLTPLER